MIPIILAIAGGGYLFFNGFRWMKQRSLIAGLATSKIRSIAMGLCEIKGKAAAPKDHMFKSPFTKHNCVYCRHTIEEYRSSGKNSRWVTIDSGVLSSHFYIKDDTGTVLIDPKGAKIDIPVDYTFQSSMAKDPPQGALDYLESIGVKYRNFFGIRKQLRFKESFIAPGDNLYVIGTATDNPFVNEGSTTVNSEDIMIHKGKAFFYISDRQENDILAKLMWMTIGGLIGGGIILLIGLFFTFAFIGIL